MLLVERSDSQGWGVIFGLEGLSLSRSLKSTHLVHTLGRTHIHTHTHKGVRRGQEGGRKGACVGGALAEGSRSELGDAHVQNKHSA